MKIELGLARGKQDHDKRNASEASPVIVNGLYFQITRGGIVSAIDAKTGKDIWEDRFQGQHLPSGIAAGDRIYYSNDRGQTHVIKAADKFELLAANQLEGGADAGITGGISLADGALFIRTKTFLYKIAENKVAEK